jgi:hypothetical protein
MSQETRPRLIGTIADRDGMLGIHNGAVFYPLGGNSGLAYDFELAFGPVQRGDIGKRVFNVRGVLQMENNEQRDERLGS